MANETLRTMIDNDKAKNKENRRAKFYLNLLRREKYMWGASKIILYNSNTYI